MTQRIGRRTRLKPEAIGAYREWHAAVWPALLALNTEAGIRNYSIFIDGVDLFSYLEVDDLEKAIASLSKSDVARSWQRLMAPLMDSEDAVNPWTLLEEVFHQN